MASPESQKRRFRLDIAYDGRPFAGWQSQVGGNTVQDILLSELQSVCPEILTVQGSGRTDAGVCATGQVAHFDVSGDWRMNGGEWQRALNSKLPPAIRVMRCLEVSPEFHARFSAGGKLYRYDIVTGDVLPPLLHGLAWHRRGLEDLERLAEVLGLYVGTHDFRAFSANRNDGKDEGRDTVRDITLAEIEPEADGVPGRMRLRFRGNGFLYKMVRFLVGTAVYNLEGKISNEEMRVLLQGCEVEKKAPFCAPPDGLSLERVYYPESLEPS
ncbi:MAG: tRNA pseudouridine(38-40) synthase TruA [Verrucomicrobiales bacterium]|nr:tRNA pseudouridine(38-40) synthase TruA [Verrucomicrobiales bacterium]